MLKTRAEMLSNIGSSKYDLIIIGGGVIGATLAYHSSKLGISTLLLEKHDFSFGSSSRTLKMFSGEYHNFSLKNLPNTFRKIRERNRLMHQSSAESLPILYPFYENGNSEVIKHELKSLLYDILSVFYKGKRHSFHTRSDTIESLPDLNYNDIIASIEYYEGSIDDSRYVMELIVNAKEYGASVINYAEVQCFQYTEKNIEKVVFTDKISNKTYEIQANNIVISAGGWGHKLSSTVPNGDFKDSANYLKASSLVISGDTLNIKKSVILPKIKDRPNVFLHKWRNSIIVGPVVKKYNGDLDCIYATSDEVEYLLDVYNTYFSAIVNKNHIITTQSGLIAENTNNVKINKHSQYKLYLVEGGNFTLSSFVANKVLHCIYDKHCKWEYNKKVINDTLPDNMDWVLSRETVEFLLSYYKSVDLIIRLNYFCKNDSSLLVNVGLDNRIPRGLIKYFIEVEQAQHLDDIMMRRLRFIITEDDCGTLLAEYVAEEMGNILKWDSKKLDWEIKRYRTEIKRARVSLY